MGAAPARADSVTTMLDQGLDLFTRVWMLPVAVLACAWVAWIGWRVDARRRARLARLGDVPVLERLLPHDATGLPPQVRAVVLGLAALCLGVAVAGPRWGERAERRRDVGVDVAMVLDVSASMLATDEGASRLDNMKADIRRLLASMPGARVALLVVAGRSYILTPLTADHDALGLFLDGLDPGMVSQGGTALAQGVAQATQLLGVSEDGSDRALVVMSDGETWDDEAEIASAAKGAGDARLAVVTVGYGTATGGTIPMGGGSVKRDADGQPVITRASAATLEGIARLADGVYVDGVSADRPGRIRAALRRLRQTERVYNAGTSPIQRYSLFLWPAFVLLLVDALFTERGRRRRAMPLAVLGMAVTLSVGPSTARAQSDASVLDPISLFRQRRFTDAVRILRENVARGDRTLRTQYNLGTALLEADSIPAATEVLDRVVTIAPDAELRYRALFNLGLANLRRARAVPEAAAAPLYSAAVAAYKRALRTRTDDADAKWNLELALREQQKGGGGGGGGASGGGGGGQQPPPAAPPPGKGQQDLEKQRADAVLNSAARDERDVQTRRQRDGQRREAAAGKDW
ncbi:MAG: VWA domain-containing protein [Gemmatimonadaceae bacterium]|nr:VWA domain-containing protein [Gemmatimonadaceae bacterium]